jgi:1-acyl-sn-glycerol-3-phosphate acyltransferase
MTIVRSTLFNVFFFTMTFIIALVPGMFVRLIAPARVMDVARMWARIMVGAARIICGIRLQVHGLERLEGADARLIASNHQSAFDTIVWLTLLPRCCYVVKQELLRIPLFGPLLSLSGMIAVDRGGGAAALRQLLREADRALREKRQIVIFPEGTRATPGVRLPLQSGVAALAARTHLPVVPVVTDSGHCWGRRAFQKRSGTIHIRVLDPVPAAISRAHLMQCLEITLRTDPTILDEAVENSVG